MHIWMGKKVCWIHLIKLDMIYVWQQNWKSLKIKEHKKGKKDLILCFLLGKDLKQTQGWYAKSCWFPWSVLLLETMLRFTIYTAVSSKEASFAVVWMTPNSKLRLRDNEGIYDSHPTPIHKWLWQRCWSVAFHSWCFWQGAWVGKYSVFFKGLVNGNLIVFQWIYGKHKLDLVFFLFWGSIKVGGLPGKNGKQVW